MSYSTKYVAYFDSDQGNNTYELKLQKDGWAGGETEIKLAGKGVKLDARLKDWWDTIVLQSCSLQIINDTSTATGWYDLSDLMTLEEREFKLVIDASYSGTPVRLFEGFINSEVVSQRYVNMSIFNITASNYITKLKDTHPDMIDTISKQTPINIIDECLQLTGKDASIFVNNTLDPSGGTLSSTKTCMNITAIDTENFWKDNWTRDGGDKIIDKILKSYDSYLYWWDGNWYIERYGDVWTSDGSRNYVGYAADGSYGYSDAGTQTKVDTSIYVLPISGPMSEYQFTNDNQQIDMIPGLNTLELKLDINKYLNLTINDFSDITANGLTTSVTYPAKRTWTCYYVDDGPPDGWQFPGYKWGILNPSIGFSYEASGPVINGQSTVYPGMTWQTISNAIYRYGAPQYWSGGVYQYNDKDLASLSTRFDFTIESETDSLEIKWKFAPIAMNGGAQAWDYRCRFHLRIPTGNRYIRYDNEGDYWEYVTNATDASSWVELLGDDIDEYTGVGEVKFTVPIGDVSGWTLGDGDFEMILNIHNEDIKQIDETDYRSYAAYPIFAYYGDVIVTSAGSAQDNTIGGVINTKTLEKKEQTINLVDIQNLNYRSGIFTGSGFEDRTTVWTDKDALGYYKISEWILYNKLQLFNKNRQRIKSDLKYNKPLKPFSLWQDNTDPSVRQYVLTGYSYFPGQDTYSNCEWREYSDDVMIVNYD